jgi:uncharacterized protein (TIGR01777 family)
MARVLISGASGLIGSALVSSIESHGHEVSRLVRRTPQLANELQWNPSQEIRPELVSGFDAVIHLSGESVTGRWTDAKKSRIRNSRIVSTHNLSHALASAERKPAVFLCASASGYYGDRGNEVLNEESPPGLGFLPEVCREWEAATEAASEAGIRTANLRFGLVLAREGGALKQILLPFRLGLGGRIGSGSQWWSWIHISDAVSAIHHILCTGNMKRRTSPTGVRLSGPINIVSANPVTNTEFTETLARVLKRPAILPVPAFAARLVFGELADEGILASARVNPTKLDDSGFEFQFPELGSALRSLI